MKKHLIVYAKRPLLGYAKTRLGKKIGLEESAGVYARFLYQCLLQLQELDQSEISGELSPATSVDIPYFRLAFPEFRVRSQTEGDLVQRFKQSFRDAFDNGAEAVVVIGTDIPDLDRSIIQVAFEVLEENDVVIGPNMDGGITLSVRSIRPQSYLTEFVGAAHQFSSKPKYLSVTRGFHCISFPLFQMLTRMLIINVG